MTGLAETESPAADRRVTRGVEPRSSATSANAMPARVATASIARPTHSTAATRSAPQPAGIPPRLAELKLELIRVSWHSESMSRASQASGWSRIVPRPKPCSPGTAEVARRVRRTQKRGEERRQRLLDSAASLSPSARSRKSHSKNRARGRHPGHFGVSLLPGQAPPARGLAARYGEAFEQIVTKPLPAAQIKRWEDVIERLIDRAVRYYKENPAARKLLIDGKSPSEIKLADRIHDRAIGALLEAAIARHFVLPEFPERVRRLLSRGRDRRRAAAGVRHSLRAHHAGDGAARQDRLRRVPQGVPVALPKAR